MKRLVIFLTLIFAFAGASAQSIIYARDIIIQKTNPILYLKGTGGVINFNNGDVTLTGSSNKVTLAGGDLDLGANTLSGTGSIGSTGSRFTKIWVTDVEATHLPTVGGATLKSALSLTATDVGLGNVTNESKSTMFASPTFTGSPTVPGYVPTSRTVNGHALTGNVTVTASDLSLGNVTNESKATMFTSPTFTGTIPKFSTTDSLATRSYARSVGGGSADVSSLTTRVDSIVTALKDTIVGSTLYVKLIPDTVQHTSNYTLQASDVYKDQHCLKATSILITVPQNFSDMPVGSTLNFFGEGAGIMVFKKGANVVFISESDSIATARKGAVVGLKKIATNKYFLYGSLLD
jgi:hypothetical protein